MKFKLSLKNLKNIKLFKLKKHSAVAPIKEESEKNTDNLATLEEEVKKHKETDIISKKEQQKKTKEKSEDEKEAEENLRLKRAFTKKSKKEKRRITKILDDYLIKAGYESTGEEFHKKVKQAAVLISIIISLALSIFSAIAAHKLHVFLFVLLITFGISLAVMYILILISSFMFLDYQVYSRTKEIEEVLPEFLQLTSANISAGMPIDRALWFAVRPKFGVLAKEIEEVAKATMAGEDLEDALENFTKKYDSKTLKESINLLVEGMRAGGEIGFLLNQIASNMQDIKIMRKEIAASVMSYVIFITAASVVGAPFLLALSSQLLFIMKGISSSVQIDDSGGSSSSFKMDLSSDSISMSDFQTFAIVVLVFSSIFSAMIISVIRKGHTSESFKIIPGYIAVSLFIYFVASWFFGNLMGGFF